MYIKKILSTNIIWLQKNEFKDRKVFNQLFLNKREKIWNYIYKKR